MTLYNLFLSTRIGAKLIADPSNAGTFRAMRIILTGAEVGLLFLLLGQLSSFSLSMTPSFLAIIVTFAVVAAYGIVRFTFGSEKHADYLELRASLGLGPEDKPLFDKNLDSSVLDDDDMLSVSGARSQRTGLKQLRGSDTEVRQIEAAERAAENKQDSTKQDNTEQDTAEETHQGLFDINEDTIEQWRREMGR